MALSGYLGIQDNTGGEGGGNTPVHVYALGINTTEKFHLNRELFRWHERTFDISHILTE